MCDSMYIRNQERLKIFKQFSILLKHEILSQLEKTRELAVKSVLISFNYGVEDSITKRLR